MRGRELGCAFLLLLAGCDTTVQETLGLGKRSPDEFQVVRRAPLVLPPDYGLRPPGTGGPPPNDPATEARGLLTGNPTPETGTAGSAGERALVASSPIQADPEVRTRLVGEDAELASLDDRTFLFILNFQRAQFGLRDETLDPGAEAARLRAVGANGSVVTSRTGSTPLPSP